MALGKTQLVAIGIAAVLVISGCAAFIILKKDNDDPPADKITAALTLYGNADNDLDIDSNDISIVQQIINGAKKLEDYPLADANKDGTVNSEDISLISKISAGEPCTVYAVSLNIDGTQTYTEIQYPLKNAVPYGTNAFISLICAGGVDNTVGLFYLQYDNAFKTLKDGVNSGDIKNYGATSGRKITDANFNAFTAHDGELIEAGKGGIGALILDHSAGAFDTRYDALNAAGIPILRLAVADPIEEIKATLLIGALMGGDAKNTALTYAQKSLEVINTIQNKIENLSNDDKHTYIALSMGCYVCQNDSTFNPVGAYAGGLAYYLTNNVFANEYEGSSSTKMSSAEALSNYDDVDFLISNRTIDVKVNPGTSLVDDWDTYYTYFENLDCYENLIYVNNILPGAIKIAFVAAIITPDCVSMEYAESVLSTFSGICAIVDGVTSDNSLIVGTYGDYKAAGGTH